MTKAVADFEENYVFSLGSECASLAEQELRETDEVRAFALKALRQWIDQNPKIVKCRYDSSFLLRFLRAKKFSIPTVQESIERYVMLRESYDDGVFQHVSLDEPAVGDLLDRGFVFPLTRRDPLGRRVLLIQPRVLDMEKHTLRDIIRLFTIITDVLVEDEENQIRGFVYLIDAGGAQLQLITLVSPKEAVRLLKNGEAIVPMRHMLGVGYNIPAGWKYAVDFALSFLSDKLRARARQVTDLASCPEIDRDMLPKELGGGAESIKDMIKMWREEMNRDPAVLQLVRQNDQMQANKKMFSQQEIEGDFRGTKTSAVDGRGWESVQGSFRQMNVD